MHRDLAVSADRQVGEIIALAALDQAQQTSLTRDQSGRRELIQHYAIALWQNLAALVPIDPQEAAMVAAHVSGLGILQKCGEFDDVGNDGFSGRGHVVFLL
jgi:hypothetical protein